MPSKKITSAFAAKIALAVAAVIVVIVVLISTRGSRNRPMTNANTLEHALEQHVAPPAAVPHIDPLNATFVIDGAPVTLKDGIATEPAAADSASVTTTQVFGTPVAADLNGDGTKDIVLTLTRDNGGSGTFIYVAAAIAKDGSYSGTNAVLVGDRVAPDTTDVKDGIISFNYADRLPWEPMTAQPSVAKTKLLAFKDGNLVEQPQPQLSEDEAATLADKAWGACTGDTCTGETVETLDGRDGVWYVQATFHAPDFDTVKDERRIAPAHFVNGAWMLGEALYSAIDCKPGHGHVEYSSEACK